MYFCTENFINNYTLNIFVDASIRRINKYRSAGCFGAVAYIGNTKVDEDYRICTKSTNNDSEIKAIRSGVGLAIKWRNQVRVINLFSDSQVSIFGLRDRIYSWKIENNKLTGSGDSVIKNQAIYIEIMNMIVNNNLIINFYHQKGHVNPDSYPSLETAVHTFISSNFVREKVDIEFIRFISFKNNEVDKTSRSYLYNTNIKHLHITDALEYTPFNFNDTLRKYNELQGGNYYVE